MSGSNRASLPVQRLREHGDEFRRALEVAWLRICRNVSVQDSTVGSGRSIVHAQPEDRDKGVLPTVGNDRSTDHSRPRIAVAWLDMIPPTPCTRAARALST